MRKMTKGDTTVEVVELIILKNYWEYYILKDDEYSTEDIKTAIVYGDATEMGDVSLSEIEPYIQARTSNLSESYPASCWKWDDCKIFN